MSEPKIVSAVGVACFSQDNPALAAEIEVAMADAVAACLEAGVSINDDATIRRAIILARMRVRRAAGLPDDD